MGEKTNTLPRFDKFGRERYMLIHKRPVGPKTAEGLFSLYEEMTETQEPRMLYMAGWAALEASWVGTHLEPETRIRFVDAAQESWEYALQLQQERAAESAWRKSTTPDTVGEYRIATALATIDVFRELPYGKPTLQSVADMHSRMVDIMLMNDHDMQAALRHGNTGRAYHHRGFAFELLSMCAVNRLFSTRLLATPAFARSDNGKYYPEQTHDVQYLYLDGGSVVDAVPNEVKTRLRTKFFERYVMTGLTDGVALTQNGHFSVSTQVYRLKAEIDDTIAPYDEFMLQDVTDTVLHSIRHVKRADTAGIHCPGRENCTIYLHDSNEAA